MTYDALKIWHEGLENVDAEPFSRQARRDLEQNADFAQTTLACPEIVLLYFFTKLREPLIHYVLTFGLPSHDCEDVIQETFLALFRHVRACKSRENLPAWLYRVAHNLALKRRAANTRLMYVADTEFFIRKVDPGADLEECMIVQQEQKRLLSIWNALSERERQCLQLRMDGLKYREIATILNISLGSVATAVTRSLVRLGSHDNSVRKD